MYKNNKILVIIPARSGSKGIKNKNIKKIKNKPLLSYSIDYAKKCNLVDEIIVSTESPKYANIAKKFGANVPFLRTKKLAGDKVQDYPVVRECLIKSENFFEMKFDYIILLRPTSPFREAKLIERGLKKLHHNKASSSVKSVIATTCHPYRHWKINKKGKLKSIINNVKEPYNIPRQQLPKFFFSSGDIEVIRRGTIFKGSVSGNYVLPLIVQSSTDIDTMQDFKKCMNNG
jgi:CMP-N,N'-diacetyllegionaminic acid synthase